MSQQDKLLTKILLVNADANIPFEQLCQLLRKLALMKEYEEVIIFSFKKEFKKF
jgi:hypothetical protein